MRLPEKMDALMDASIDFSEFYILDVIPTPDHRTATLLVMRQEGKQPYTCNLQYRDRSCFYASVDNMLNQCLNNSWISPRQAKQLKNYYLKRKEAHYA